MAILELLVYPDERLRQKAKPVEKVDKEIQKLMDDMLETMYHEEGIGLASIQVGVPKRVIVMDIGRGSKRYEGVDEKKSNPIQMANPEVIWESDEKNCYDEGCLSFPEQYSEVERPKRVKVKYLDYNNKEQVLECDELLATCVQHEIDHLDGIVFIDHISAVKRDMIKRKLIKKKKLESKVNS